MKARISETDVAKRAIGYLADLRWEVITGGLILIDGGVPRMVGGKRKWDEDDAVKVVVSQDEIRAEYLRYEAETGKCGECFGEEKVYTGWSRETGPRFKPCPKCQSARGLSLFDKDTRKDAE